MYLTFQAADEEHNEFKWARRFILVARSFPYVLLFLQELGFTILIEAKGLVTCLQVERVDLEILACDKKRCDCGKLEVFGRHVDLLSVVKAVH